LELPPTPPNRVTISLSFPSLFSLCSKWKGIHEQTEAHIPRIILIFSV
jgi:flagellar biosynthesis protein FliQ